MKPSQQTDSQATKLAASHASRANAAAVTVTAVTAASAVKVTALEPAPAMAASGLPKAVPPPSLQSQISLQPPKTVRKQLLIL